MSTLGFTMILTVDITFKCYNDFSDSWIRQKLHLLMNGNGLYVVGAQYDQESVFQMPREQQQSQLCQLNHDEIMAVKSMFLLLSHSQSSRLWHFPHHPSQCWLNVFKGEQFSRVGTMPQQKPPQHTENHNSFLNVIYRIPSVNSKWLKFNIPLLRR